jgi:GAF domain-containing protein
MTDQRQLAARFAEVSSDLLATSAELTFQAVAQRAVEITPGCDAASITLLGRRGRATTVASTDPVCECLDDVQYAVGEGPCLDAAFELGTVIVHDVVSDHRWPEWAAAAHQRGLGSAVAVRLHTAKETLGALNLYSRTRGGFDVEAVDIAAIYAVHATEAMSKARLVSGLQAAMESRHLIGIAQGILAVRYDIGYEAAFDVLHRYSNDTNTKLRDVAARVVEERGLPAAESVPEPRDELDPA